VPVVLCLVIELGWRDGLTIRLPCAACGPGRVRVRMPRAPNRAHACRQVVSPGSVGRPACTTCLVGLDQRGCHRQSGRRPRLRAASAYAFGWSYVRQWPGSPLWRRLSRRPPQKRRHYLLHRPVRSSRQLPGKLRYQGRVTGRTQSHPGADPTAGKSVFDVVTSLPPRRSLDVPFDRRSPG
jgi:hypothetical protein